MKKIVEKTLNISPLNLSLIWKKQISSKKRALVLGSFFVVTVILAWQPNDHSVSSKLSAVASELKPVNPLTVKTRSDPSLSKWVLKFKEPRFNQPGSSDPFSAPSWQQPVAFPPKESLPVKPVAAEPASPVFNYTYLGKVVTEEQKIMILLGRGEESFSLFKGDVLEGLFRIDEVKEEQLEVTHIATSTRLSKRYDDLGGKQKSNILPEIAPAFMPPDFQNYGAIVPDSNAVPMLPTELPTIPNLATMPAMPEPANAAASIPANPIAPPLIAVPELPK